MIMFLYVAVVKRAVLTTVNALYKSPLLLLLGAHCIKVPIYAQIHYRTQSYDLIGCLGNSVEWTNEIAYRI